jgi:hypothetical protein
LDSPRREFERRQNRKEQLRPAATSIESIFDLGSSGGSIIAKEMDAMIGEAFDVEAPLPCAGTGERAPRHKLASNPADSPACRSALNLPCERR